MRGESWASCCWVQCRWKFATTVFLLEFCWARLQAVKQTLSVIFEDGRGGRDGKEAVKSYVLIRGKEWFKCQETLWESCCFGTPEAIAFQTMQLKKTGDTRHFVWYGLRLQVVIESEQCSWDVDVAEKKNETEAAQKRLLHKSRCTDEGATSSWRTSRKAGWIQMEWDNAVN